MDTLLTALREVIRDADDLGFPAAEMQQVMAQRGKSLEFSAEEIEDLADLGIRDRRTFGLLALLSPFIGLQRNQFHIDHIFPAEPLTRRRLCDAGKAAETWARSWIALIVWQTFSYSMGPAISKSRQRFRRIGSQPSIQTRKHGGTTVTITFLTTFRVTWARFLEFYEARRTRLQGRISELVNLV